MVVIRPTQICGTKPRHDLPNTERSSVTVNDQDPYSMDNTDADPEETAEWSESLDALVAEHGHERGREIMLSLLKRSKELHLGVPMVPTTDYINTIAAENEPAFPGDEDVERRYRAWIRWNAAMLVHRAQRPGIAVGGHIATYASSAALYEVGFNHFFRGQNHPGGGDQIFIQGHASPGTYARAFLEGRLSADQLDGFRQEKSHVGGGLSSYPHPRLMPEFWQFPTVSMGLGPINAIYQAQANKYLTNRGIKDASDQQVWAFLGDGEMDEVESRGQLQVAANEGLDNLNFIINCNLQRLDGPVRGNGKIVQEMATTRRTRPRAAPTSAKISSVATRVRSSSSRATPTTRSGTSSAVATTTARSTPRSRPRQSIRASRPASWRRPSRAMDSDRASRAATRPTR